MPSPNGLFSPKTTAVLLVKLLALLALALLTPPFLLAQYDINTVAGGGPNGLAALQSSIGYPTSVVLDGSGNIYIADSWSSRVLKVSAGTVTVVAGNDSWGYAGDGGTATSATLGIHGPGAIAVDGAGNLYIADSENSLIREVVASTGIIQTVAGNFAAGPGYSGDGGPAPSAQLNTPFGIAVDGAGNLYIADTGNCIVRKVSGGTISTIAGTATSAATCGYAGDGASATAAQLDFPEGVFVDGSGNVFIADSFNNLIRVVNTGAASTTIAGVAIPAGYIQTVVGAYYNSEGGTECAAYSNSGPALSAQLCAPSNVFVDSSKDIFLADWGNSVIREVAAPGSTIATVAGNGTAGYSGDGAATSVELNFVNAMFVDSEGDIYIADTDNFLIREVSGGNLTTVIGNSFLGYSGDGGAALDAELNNPAGGFIDGSDNIYIADSVSSVIREVTSSNGDIQTVAGNGTDCSSSTAACGDGGLATSAQLNSPFGVFLDGSGNIYIADSFDNRIREVVASTGNIQTVAGNGNECGVGMSWPCGDGGSATAAQLFQPLSVALDTAGNIFIADTDDQAIRVVNTGTAALTLAGVTIPAGAIATVAGSGTQCSSASSACGDGGAATSAQLSFPNGIFIDSSDNIYIADAGDNRVRVVNTGTNSATIGGVTVPAGNIATVAGTGVEGYSGDGALATSALLAGPNSVFVDSTGDIFISDTGNFVIREVVAGSWEIATVAGNNTEGFSGDGSVATNAQFTLPLGLFGDAAANLFVADTNSSRIRELTPTAGAAPSAAQPAPQTVSPGGTASFDIELNANTGNPKYPITLSCLQSSLPANATCSFSPATIRPGPLPVPFTMTVTVPAATASLHKPTGMRLHLVFAFVPLAGIFFAGIGLGKHWRRWLILAVLVSFVVLLNACGGSGSGSGTGGGTNYTIQVTGTTAAQATPFTITTATLTVQ